MPDSCCAFKSTNRRIGANRYLKFYRIPSKHTEEKAERRARWISAIKRDRKEWPEEKINNARLCNAHFVTG